MLVAQFGGAAGTLASLGEGEAALASCTELARELGLGEPPITWHVARDPIVETVQFLALLGGSLGKIAFDIMLMSATEFGEAAEPFVAGRGSSSTMPQKRNPISCELILAAAQGIAPACRPRFSTRWSAISSAPPAPGMSNGSHCRRVSAMPPGPCIRLISCSAG